MDDLWRRIGELLGSRGIRLKPPARTASSGERVVVLRRGRARQTFRVLNGPALTFSDVARAPSSELPTLFATTYVSRRTAQALRKAGIQYIDAAGNAWIDFADLLLDVQGRPRDEVPVARVPSTENLFSAGRSKVVIALLAWPQLWEAPRRDVASAAGVSLGTAQATMALLDEAGYGPGRSPGAARALLDLWSAAFPSGLARRLALAEYRGGIEHPRPVDTGQRMFRSGESAVPDLLRPVRLTLYVDDLDPMLPVMNRWRSDGPPNITVRRAFWRPPAGLEEAAGLDDPPVAPWPLVYADLMATDDPRVHAAAQEWRQRSAGPDPSP